MCDVNGSIKSSAVFDTRIGASADASAYRVSDVMIVMLRDDPI